MKRADADMVAPRPFRQGSFIMRAATMADLDALVSLEGRCFSTDQLSRRNFAWMICKGHSALWMAMDGDVLVGYVLVLYRTGTSRGRIYSIAVNPDFRGQRIGDALLQVAEAAARAAGCTRMHLEVRPDNAVAIRLYEKHGYRQVGVYRQFYGDGTHALRFGKHILPSVASGTSAP
ncbi:MAG: ribosomal protein S18-alanine N-acetyltransferase [Pseudomonadota bacterium]